jgi:hypothetical protein
MGEHAKGDPANTGRRPSFALEGQRMRALLRLCHRLHAPASGPAEAKRRLISGLCDFLGADSGVCVVSTLDEETARREVVSVVRSAGGPSPTGGTARLPPVRWHDSPANGVLLRPGRAAHTAGRAIESTVRLLHEPPLHASLALARGARGPAFTAQDVAVLEVVHEECSWLYAADLPLASRRVRGLPARARYVLQYLLAGEGEADVARLLGLSPGVVRSEGKAAYGALRAAHRERRRARSPSGG